MKKRVLVFSLIGVMIFSLCGCGKKDPVNEYSEYYQEELGLSKEDADEMAELAAGFAEEMAEEEEKYQEQKAQEQAAEEEMVNAFKLIEPSKEIIDSKFGDDIVQIGECVFHTDDLITVKDAVDEFSKYGQVRLERSGEEITESTLDSDKKGSIGSYTVIDEYDQELCTIHYIKPTDEVSSPYDNIVEYFSNPGSHASGLNNLNYFLAGNICAGVYDIDRDYMETPEYQQRLSEYPIPTYQEAEEYLKSKGADIVLFERLASDRFHFYAFGDKPLTINDEVLNRVTEYSFYIDMDNAVIRGFEISTLFGEKEEYIGGFFEPISYDELLEVWDRIPAEEVNEAMCDAIRHWDKSYCDDSCEVLGLTLTKSLSYDIGAICLTDKNLYVLVHFSTFRKYDGSYSIGSSTLSSLDGYDTLDNLLAGEMHYDDDKYTLF